MRPRIAVREGRTSRWAIILHGAQVKAVNLEEAVLAAAQQRDDLSVLTCRRGACIMAVGLFGRCGFKMKLAYSIYFLASKAPLKVASVI